MNASGGESGDRLVQVVAGYKLLKALALVATGVGLFKLARPDLGDLIEQWVMRVGLDPDGEFVGSLIDKIASISPHHIRQAGALICAYSSLYFAQGIGLWMLKPWAEWLTIVATSLMIPVEVYQVFRHATILKAAILGLNAAIVAYLGWRLRCERRARRSVKPEAASV